LRRGGLQASVPCPQFGPARQSNGCEQMGIHTPDAEREQRSAIDEVEYFLVSGHSCLGQFSQRVQNEITLP